MEEEQSVKMELAVVKIKEAEKLMIEAYAMNAQTRDWNEQYHNRVYDGLKIIRELKDKL